MARCLDECRQTFSNHFSYRFCPILAKLGTHDPCANMQETGTEFRNFDLKNFGNFFLNFESAVELSGMPGLL